MTSRTNFIDAALDRFLNAVDETGAGRPQVVVLGAGFDTRAMRYAERATAAGASFFELDLPHVCSGKSGLWDRWASKGGREGLTKPRYVPYRLAARIRFFRRSRGDAGGRGEHLPLMNRGDAGGRARGSPSDE